MIRLLAKNWWTVVLRGVCAILFGVLALAWPGVTLGALILWWAAYAFVDGVLSIVAAISGAGGQPWWVLTLEGLVGLGAAAAAILAPGLTAIVLLWIIAGWAVATGVLEVVAAIRLRKEIEGELWLGLAGVVSILFGFMLLTRPAAGALAVVWIIGVYALVFGASLVGLGFRLKGFRDRLAGA